MIFVGICVSEVEARPPLMAANSSSENKFASTKQSAKTEKVRKTASAISRIKTELPATKVTEEEPVHTKGLVNEEKLLKRVILEHPNDILINKDILKAGISNVVHLEIDRKQGQDNSLRTEGNIDKLNKDPGIQRSRI